MAHEDDAAADPIALGDDLLAALAFIDDLACANDTNDDDNSSSSCDVLLHELRPLDDETALSHVIGASTTDVVSERAQPPPPPQKKRARTWNPNRARNARREELIYLRAQVADLEKQLAAARAVPTTHSDARPRPRPPSTLQSAPLCSKHGSSLSRLWEDVAANQWCKRSSAERENMRLRLALASQVKVAKSLKRALERAVSTRDELARCVGGHRHPLDHMHSPPVLTLSDSAIVDTLVIGVEQSYAEIDDVYRASGLDQRETSHFDVRVRRDNNTSSSSSDASDSATGLCLELEAAKVLPFALDATAQTVWDHFVEVKDRLPSRFYYDKSQQVVGPTTRMIVETFHAELHAKGTTARFRVHQVVRRYDEADRVVIVWRAHVDPLALGDELLRGVGFLEKGYIVIKKTTEAATLLQPCFIITPSFSEVQAADGETTHVKSTVGAVTDFMLAATAANIHASHDMIEDVLMQAALASRSSAV